MLTSLIWSYLCFWHDLCFNFQPLTSHATSQISPKYPEDASPMAGWSVLVLWHRAVTISNIKLCTLSRALQKTWTFQPAKTEDLVQRLTVQFHIVSQFTLFSDGWFCLLPCSQLIDCLPTLLYRSLTWTFGWFNARPCHHLEESVFPANHQHPKAQNFLLNNFKAISWASRPRQFQITQKLWYVMI